MHADYETRSGPKHWKWKGGRVRLGKYIGIYTPEHPRAYIGKGTYVNEHILVAERVLGRFMKPGEIVHHVNEDGTDNRKCNLVICESHDYHCLLHQRMRAFKACGHANWRPCACCGKHDDPKNMKLWSGGRVAVHAECARISNKAIRDRIRKGKQS